MTQLDTFRPTEVAVETRDPWRLGDFVDPPRAQEFAAALGRARDRFAGRTVWHVNSTAKGGGVAEMLRPLIGYSRGAEIDMRWAVIEGDAGFFDITKRIHNRLHGACGDGDVLGAAEQDHYTRVTRANAEALADLIADGDLVVLHDPQTAGLVPALARRGLPTVWRCHIGVDEPNDLVRETWRFLSPFLEETRATVFSRRSYVWETLDSTTAHVVQPSIDPLAPKNYDLDPESVTHVLVAAGVMVDGAPQDVPYRRPDGTTARIERRATVTQSAELDDKVPLVTQISRWDGLKDPAGVMLGFGRYVAPHSDAHLVLAGPAVTGVADDPEASEVWGDVSERWQRLPARVRDRIHLIQLSMVDEAENAVIVNALQRRSDVVVQKSIAEGFGLTIAEAMWKRRAMVASDVGGIPDQVDHEVGILLSDPRDLAGFGAAVRSLLEDDGRRAAMGDAARARVADRFLISRQLTDLIGLLADVDGISA